MALKTKKRIIEAAIEVFSKNPFASLDEVAEAAEVGRATLFRNFSTRKNLLNQLSLEVENEFKECMEALDLESSEPLESFKDFIAKLIPIAGKYQFLVYEPLRSQDTEHENAYKSNMKRLQKIIEEFQKIGLISKKLPSYWAAIVCDRLVFNVWETIEEGQATVDEATNLVFNAITSGIFIASNHTRETRPCIKRKTK